jgi:hypothetical protein
MDWTGQGYESNQYGEEEEEEYEDEDDDEELEDEEETDDDEEEDDEEKDDEDDDIGEEVNDHKVLLIKGRLAGDFLRQISSSL